MIMHTAQATMRLMIILLVIVFLVKVMLNLDIDAIDVQVLSKRPDGESANIFHCVMSEPQREGIGNTTNTDQSLDIGGTAGLWICIPVLRRRQGRPCCVRSTGLVV